MITSDSDKQISLVGDEFPFYQNEEFKEKETVKDIAPINATRLANYKLSRATAPVPNTVIPLLDTGKFPAGVIPASALIDFIIYSRDGLHTYTLKVEANGALSVDPLS